MEGIVKECLVCGLDLTLEEDLKPVRLDSREWREWKENFGIFCKVVGVTGNLEGILEEVEGIEGGGDGEGMLRVPGCGRCCGGLGEVGRLQRQIEEMEKRKEEQVRILKELLVLGGGEEYKVWGRLRKQLIACFNRQEPVLDLQSQFLSTFSKLQQKPQPARSSSSRRLPNILRRAPKNPVSVEFVLPEDTDDIPEEDPLAEVTSPSPPIPAPTPPVKKVRRFLVRKKNPTVPTSSASTPIIPVEPQPEVTTTSSSTVTRPCSVVLTRLSSPVAKTSSKIKNQEESSDKLVVTGQRKSKVRALSFLKETLNPSKRSPSPEPQSPQNQDDDFHFDQDDFAESEPESESESESELESPPDSPEPPKRSKINFNAPPRTINPKHGKFFHQLTPNLLLFKSTPILVSSGGTQLTCQEPQCHFQVQDVTSYSSVFSQIQLHIETSHGTLPSEKVEVPLKCPLCPFVEVETRFKFRRHCLSTHWKDNLVVCEICWKPIKHLADNYKIHNWNHKNHQEKQENVPRQLVYNSMRTKSGLKKEYILNLLDEMKQKSERSKPEVEDVVEPGVFRIKPRAKSKYIHGQKPKRQKEEPKGPKGITLFWKVDEDKLLYKFTPVQVSNGGTRLTCQDAECTEEFFVEDLSSFSEIFTKMRAHIEGNHVPKKNSLENLLNLQCPLCPEVLFERWPFRRHVLKEHKLEIVICEVCWRPLKHNCGNYARHLWFHLNDEEKAESVVPLPRTVVYNAFKCKKGERLEMLKRLQLVDQEQKELEVKQVVKKKVFLPRTNAGWVTTSEIFAKLNDNLLMYKYSFLRVEVGEGVYCQEGDCTKLLARFVDYDGLASVKEHMETCHLVEEDYARKIRQCPFCPEQFQIGRDWRNHLVGNGKQHGEVQFICQSCQKPLASEFQVGKHEKMHLTPKIEQKEMEEPLLETEKPWKCLECGKRFGSKTNLKSHQIIHVPKHLRSTQHVCDYCGEFLCTPAGLRNHIERKHRPDLKRFRNCPICNQQFNYREGFKFKIHLRIHRGERPHQCDTCGKAFANPALFKKHQQRVHTDQRVFQCEFCDMNYKHRGNLKRHREQSHKDKVEEKGIEERLKFTSWEHRPDFIGPKIKYPCPVCEKVFELRSRMTKHLKKSHGEYQEGSGGGQEGNQNNQDFGCGDEWKVDQETSSSSSWVG